MWLLATEIFKFYLQYFARYDILYGNEIDGIFDILYNVTTATP